MKPSNPSPHLSGMEKGNKHTFAGFWTVILTFMHSLCVSLSLSHTHTHTQTTILLHSLVTHHQIVFYLDPCKRRWLACLSSHCRESSSSLAHSNLDTHRHTHISHIKHTYTHTHTHIQARTHTCMHVCKQAGTHAHTHARIHTHTHTCTHTHTELGHGNVSSL